MRYTPYFLILVLLLGAVSAPAAMASEKDVEEENPAMEFHHPDWGPGMAEQMGMDVPYECWYERPWNFWRHLDEGVLDLDAIHYMGNVRTIAIFPFVDCTEPTGMGDSKLEEVGGPRRIVENLAAVLMSRGYLVIPPMDVAAVVSAHMYGTTDQVSQEIANNSFYFRNMPERAVAFHLEVVPGLQDQYERAQEYVGYLSPDDIRKIAVELGADCVVRGYINEFALSTDIDADWRTFVPPFLGLINPDRRAMLEVAYYLYDGPSGELIWNGSVEVSEDYNWPLFESESELINETEHEVVWGMTDRVLPNWWDLVMDHPEWMPPDMWHEFDEGMWGECMYRPDWLNPMRDGWHECHRRHDWRMDGEPVEEGRRLRFRRITHHYNTEEHCIYQNDD